MSDEVLEMFALVVFEEPKLTADGRQIARPGDHLTIFKRMVRPRERVEIQR